MAYARRVTELPSPPTARTPTLECERGLWEAGHPVVVGVDEVGWGAWAGPVSVGAAVVPTNRLIPERLQDSKTLKKERQREALFERVRKWCTHWVVGHATHAECDEMGLSEARSLAARRALDALGVERGPYILVDGKTDFVGSDRYETECLPKGDAFSVSISAAAILAKVVRDRIMRDLSVEFPGYDFESNKGYHSRGHEAALLARGPSGIHRGSVKVRVTLKDLAKIGYLRHVRSEPVDAPSSTADYSRLSQWVDPDGVTRPPTIRQANLRYGKR